MRHTIALLFSILFLASQAAFADSPPARAYGHQAMSHDVPLALIVQHTVPADASIVYIDPRLRGLTTSIPSHLTGFSALNYALDSLGLDSRWLGRSLLIWQHEQPYVLGESDPDERRLDRAHFIVPPGKIADMFTSLATQHRKFPLIEQEPDIALSHIPVAMRFSGDSLEADMAHFTQEIAAVTQGRIRPAFAVTNSTVVLTMSRVGAPSNATDIQRACYATQTARASASEMMRHTKTCNDAGIKVYSNDRRAIENVLSALED